MADLVQRRIRRGAQESFGGDDLPGRAEAALEGVLLGERLLHRSELFAVHQSLDGGDLRAVGFDRERVSLVANRTGARGAVSRSDIEHALDAPIAYELPDDPAIPATVNRAHPIVLAKERSKFARALTDLAGDVLQDPEQVSTTPKRRFLGGRR